MQEIRDSIKFQEEKEILQKESMLYDAMKLKGLTHESRLSGDMDFIKEIQLNTEHIQWQILANCYFNLTNNLTSMVDFQKSPPLDRIDLHSFVSECMQALKRFHLELQEMDWNITINQEYIKQLNEQLVILENQEIKCEENILKISYIQEKAFQTDIFKHYRIKYKLGNEENYDPSYLSLYAHKDHRSCVIPMNLDVESLNFFIFGKRLSPSIEGEDFKILSVINLPLYEVLTAFKFKHLSSEIIPSCFLELSYVDELPDAPFKDVNIFEIKFDLRSNMDGRVKIIHRLLNYYKELEKGLLHQTDKRYILLIIVQDCNGLSKLLSLLSNIYSTYEIKEQLQGIKIPEPAKDALYFDYIILVLQIILSQRSNDETGLQYTNNIFIHKIELGSSLFEGEDLKVVLGMQEDSYIENIQQFNIKNHSQLNQQLQILKKSFTSLSDILLSEVTSLSDNFGGAVTYLNQKVDYLTTQVDASTKVTAQLNTNQQEIEQEIQNLIKSQLTKDHNQQQFNEQTQIMTYQQEQELLDSKAMIEKVKIILQNNNNQIEAVNKDKSNLTQQLLEIRTKMQTTLNSFNNLEKKQYEQEEYNKSLTQELQNKLNEIRTQNHTEKDFSRNEIHMSIRELTSIVKSIEDRMRGMDDNLEQSQLQIRQKLMEFESKQNQQTENFQQDLQELSQIYKDSSYQIITDFDRVSKNQHEDLRKLSKKVDLLEQKNLLVDEVQVKKWKNK